MRLLRNKESVANEIIAPDGGTFAKLPPRGSQQGMRWGPARLTPSSLDSLTKALKNVYLVWDVQQRRLSFGPCEIAY